AFRKGQPVRSGTRAGWSSSTRALNRAAETPEHALALIGPVPTALAVVIGSRRRLHFTPALAAAAGSMALSALVA
ncbi:MAG: hypothetical protein ACLQU3_03895, partial [Limisphaerales bacterium]